MSAFSRSGRVNVTVAIPSASAKSKCFHSEVKPAEARKGLTGEGSPDAGGGDIEIATSFPQAPTLANPPTLSMVSLTLANVTGAKSLNRGNTWQAVHKNPVAANAPPVDRQ